MKKPNTARLCAAVFGTGLAVALPAQAALVLTFSDSVGHPLPIDNSPCSGIAWTAGAEFRLCDPTGTSLGTGLPLQKNVLNGGEQWIFNDAGVLTGVSGTPGNPGTLDEEASGSAAPVAGTNPTLHQTLALIVAPMNLLAPIQDSLAAAAYGAGVFLNGLPPDVSENTPFLHFPVIEMQWAGAWLPLGQASGGVTFYADIYNIVAGDYVPGLGSWYGFDFHLHASEYVDPGEDPNGVGFSGWTLQWELQGQGVYSTQPPVPVPAAVWLFGSGMLGLFGVIVRRR